MNRRNFFSLALMSIGAVLCGRQRPSLLPADGHWHHLTMISDPGHRHNLLDNGHWCRIEPAQGVKINPNWIPAEGQWVMVGDKPMHYVHYDLV